MTRDTPRLEVTTTIRAPRQRVFEAALTKRLT
jgi:uncharacterized protein YndB with AHSA1/START domain